MSGKKLLMIVGDYVEDYEGIILFSYYSYLFVVIHIVIVCFMFLFDDRYR